MMGPFAQTIFCIHKLELNVKIYVFKFHLFSTLCVIIRIACWLFFCLLASSCVQQFCLSVGQIAFKLFFLQVGAERENYID